MVRLRKEYEQAVEFRKRGFTYSEIAKIVGVSKATVANWLSKKAFSKRIKEDNVRRAAKENAKRIGLLNKARGNQYKRLYKETEATAILEFKHFKKEPLFVAGLMLYLGEGDSTNARLVRLTTRRKEVHRLFIAFAGEYLGVPREKIRFWLLLYPDLDPTACMRAWNKVLKLSPVSFYKNQVIQGRNKKRTLHHGVGNTIIGSAVLKCKLMKWIELALEEF